MLFQEMLSEVPVFLATDVLNGTAVTPDNQPRIHARYGKQGLATKLLFPAGEKHKIYDECSLGW